MDKLLQVSEWLAARMEEPSTWAGGGVIFVLIHSLVRNQALADSIMAVLAAIGGLLAIVVPQPGRTTITNNLTVSNTATVALPKDSTTIISSEAKK